MGRRGRTAAALAAWLLCLALHSDVARAGGCNVISDIARDTAEAVQQLHVNQYPAVCAER